MRHAVLLPVDKLKWMDSPLTLTKKRLHLSIKRKGQTKKEAPKGLWGKSLKRFCVLFSFFFGMGTLSVSGRHVACRVSCHSPSSLHFTLMECLFFIITGEGATQLSLLFLKCQGRKHQGNEWLMDFCQIT